MNKEVENQSLRPFIRKVDKETKINSRPSLVPDRRPEISRQIKKYKTIRCLQYSKSWTRLFAFHFEIGMNLSVLPPAMRK